MVKETIQTTNCKSAAEFIDLLRPERWRQFGHAWVFRGHSNNKWELRPSALRPEIATRMKSYLRKGSYDSPQWVEFCTLVAFVEGLDRQGLLIPGERPELRDSLRYGHYLKIFKSKLYDENEHRTSKWPTEEYFQVLALAQHYGVPTRLLDWSRRSFVAAYFATSEAAESLARGNGRPDVLLEVWAYDWYASQKEPVRVSDDGPSEPVELVRVPSGLNSNLAAQEGVFTLARVMTAEGPGLEKLLPSRFFRRFTLRWDRAAAALRLLHDYRVDANSIYPGIGGAARAALEMSLYPR